MARAKRSHRPRLVDRIEAAATRKLTLVAAPLGFGKTTALAQWGRSTRCLVAALTADARDNDPVRFVTRIARAIDCALGAPQRALRNVRLAIEHGIPSHDALLAPVLDALLMPVHLAVVIDDYDVLTAPEVQELVARLLERTGEHVHIVLAARTEPDLPIGKLRARGDFIEIRENELRSNEEEARCLLERELGAPPSEADLGAAMAGTGGWVSALRLFAVALVGATDPSAFTRGLACGEVILDEEVLRQRPESIRSFLAHTSILPFRDAATCRAVCPDLRVEAAIAALAEQGLLLGGGETGRYSGLATLDRHLVAQLERDEPELLRELHRRAAKSLSESGDLEIAFDHAIAAQDFERAAALLEELGSGMLARREVRNLLRDLARVPEASIERRPSLSEHRRAAVELAGTAGSVPQRQRDGSSVLSERELTVLRLTDAGYSTREMGARLCISVETVRVYAKRAVAKLGAATRTDAVLRARSLNLLP